ncbi:metallo phosphoesterase [Xanthomonas phage Xoo-sp13]|nr:metallo phosphoesterase [Xanthomonas phage Xoo-sp13]
MIIRELSDIHLEQAAFFIPPMKHDGDAVLVLSGDIANAMSMTNKVHKFFESCVHRFKAIVYVPGNHEYYGGHIEDCDTVIKQWLLDQNYSNVHYLNKDSVVIEDVAFIGASLWTDVRKGNPIDIHHINSQLNDYHYIFKGEGDTLHPRDTIAIHHEHRKYIFSEIVKYRSANVRKIVVISHHAPTELSVVPRFKNSVINGGFVSDMYEDIICTPPDVWFHGHCHDTIEYVVSTTDVYCNPRGYAKVLNVEQYDNALNTITEIDMDSPDSVNSMVQFEELFRQENTKFNPFFTINI